MQPQQEIYYTYLETNSKIDIVQILDKKRAQ